MEKDKLRDYCVKYYENALNYLKMVLRDFTMDQIQQKHGDGKSAGELLFHAVATPHFWMKRADRGFEFRAKFETPEEAIALWSRQLEVFKGLLKDDNEVVYNGAKSIPWIMIRSCNHLVHHMGMIIFIRNILGLPALEGIDDFNWSKMVDFHGDYFFS